MAAKVVYQGLFSTVKQPLKVTVIYCQIPILNMM